MHELFVLAIKKIYMECSLEQINIAFGRMRWKRGAKVGQRPLNQFLLCDPGVVSFKHTVIMVCRSTGFTNFRCLFDCSRLFEKLQFFLQDCQNDLGIVAQFAVFFAAPVDYSECVQLCRKQLQPFTTEPP